jgi:TetR/AcrR family transcriptional repressor of nem operon
MYGMAGTRSAVIEATEELLAEGRYVDASPRNIVARTGAGQGSLYRHFRGKADLAGAVLGEVSAEMCASADGLIDAHADPLQAVLAWELASRAALRSCRSGRLTAEPVLDKPAIAEPIAAYFRHVQHRLTTRLADADAAGRPRGHLNPVEVAAALAAIVEGGYVLACTTGDAEAMSMT